MAQAHGGHIENEPTGLIDNLINQWLTGFFDGFFQNLLSICLPGMLQDMVGEES